ncbi:hypothetical protein BLNAU_8601 [Blattamonas nauphoetae]|uniref:RRM domain-containing protein n=1 Tax=Blattamonas nauphoetae TaxID=2049346 RepID=A0ABQ9XY38_9EUKA|nr:hypothetical protein BLNAU_8601 [Blattamonas nauphoetae]
MADLYMPHGISNDEEEGRGVFVGDLPQDVTNDQIKEFFEDFGPVSRVYFKMDRKKKCRLRYGFIYFEHKETVAKVLDHPHPLMLNGSPIRVKMASKNTSIVISSVPQSLSFEILLTWLRTYGEIESHEMDGKRKTCFVKFKTRSAAEQAKRDLDNRALFRRDTTSTNPPGAGHAPRGSNERTIGTLSVNWSDGGNIQNTVYLLLNKGEMSERDGKNFDESVLEQHFGRFGHVERIDLPRINGILKGNGKIHFSGNVTGVQNAAEAVRKTQPWVLLGDVEVTTSLVKPTQKPHPKPKSRLTHTYTPQQSVASSSPPYQITWVGKSLHSTNLQSIKPFVPRQHPPANNPSHQSPPLFLPSSSQQSPPLNLPFFPTQAVSPKTPPPLPTPAGSRTPPFSSPNSQIPSNRSYINPSFRSPPITQFNLPPVEPPVIIEPDEIVNAEDLESFPGHWAEREIRPLLVTGPDSTPSFPPFTPESTQQSVSTPTTFASQQLPNSQTLSSFQYDGTPTFSLSLALSVSPHTASSFASSTHSTLSSSHAISDSFTSPNLHAGPFSAQFDSISHFSNTRTSSYDSFSQFHNTSDSLSGFQPSSPSATSLPPNTMSFPSPSMRSLDGVHRRMHKQHPKGRQGADKDLFAIPVDRGSAGSPLISLLSDSISVHSALGFSQDDISIQSPSLSSFPNVTSGGLATSLPNFIDSQRDYDDYSFSEKTSRLTYGNDDEWSRGRFGGEGHQVRRRAESDDFIVFDELRNDQTSNSLIENSKAHGRDLVDEEETKNTPKVERERRREAKPKKETRKRDRGPAGGKKVSPEHDQKHPTIIGDDWDETRSTHSTMWTEVVTAIDTEHPDEGPPEMDDEDQLGESSTGGWESEENEDSDERGTVKEDLSESEDPSP